MSDLIDSETVKRSRLTQIVGFVGGFVSWNDIVFAVEVCYVINNIFVIEYRSH